MSLRRCTAHDLVRISSRKITDEGYLIAPGTIARTGVQVYTAKELGLDEAGTPPGKTIRLFRPADEVFEPSSLATFDGKPITLGHPPDDVTADNWRQRAVGDVRDVAVDGQHMAGTLIVRDKAAIRAVLDGRDQISNGYSFEYDPTPGKTADGAEYDGVQRKIRGNHVAIVDFARGGAALRIADQQPGERHMALRKIVVDGYSIEMEDTQASIVERIVGDAGKTAKSATDAQTAAEKRATDAETALASEKANTAKLVADHNAAIAELQGKILKPDQIEAMVIERAKVVGDAALLCPEYKPAGKTIPAIRAEVLAEVIAKDEALKPVAAAVLGGVEPAKAAEPIARAAFDAVVAARGTRPDDTAARANDEIAARAFAGTKPDPKSPPALRGRDLYLQRLQSGFAPEAPAK